MTTPTDGSRMPMQRKNELAHLLAESGQVGGETSGAITALARQEAFAKATAALARAGSASAAAALSAPAAAAASAGPASAGPMGATTSTPQVHVAISELDKDREFDDMRSIIYHDDNRRAGFCEAILRGVARMPINKDCKMLYVGGENNVDDPDAQQMISRMLAERVAGRLMSTEAEADVLKYVNLFTTNEGRALKNKFGGLYVRTGDAANQKAILEYNQVLDKLSVAQVWNGIRFYNNVMRVDCDDVTGKPTNEDDRDYIIRVILGPGGHVWTHPHHMFRIAQRYKEIFRRAGVPRMNGTMQRPAHELYDLEMFYNLFLKEYEPDLVSDPHLHLARMVLTMMTGFGLQSLLCAGESYIFAFGECEYPEDRDTPTLECALVKRILYFKSALRDYLVYQNTPAMQITTEELSTFEKLRDRVLHDHENQQAVLPDGSIIVNRDAFRKNFYYRSVIRQALCANNFAWAMDINMFIGYKGYYAKEALAVFEKLHPRSQGPKDPPEGPFTGPRVRPTGANADRGGCLSDHHCGHYPRSVHYSYMSRISSVDFYNYAAALLHAYGNPEIIVAIEADTDAELQRLNDAFKEVYPEPTAVIQ